MSFLGKAIYVLIVLAAIYAGAATVVSFINEAIASFFQKRGQVLKSGLVHLVCSWKEIIEDIYAHPLIQAGTSNFGRAGKPSYIDARNFSLAFWQRLQDRLGGGDAQTAAVLLAAPERLISDLQQRVAAIDPRSPGIGPLKSTLGTMLARAEGDYEKLLVLTDDWYNRQMDRVSGWYRRTMQWWILGIGFLIAFMFSIDTIRIATYLSDDQVRQQVTSTLTQHLKAGQTPEQDAANLDDALMQTQVPIDHFIATSWGQMFDAFHRDNEAKFSFTGHFLGTLITALALTLGAPFWFDTLSTLVNVRMAGNKPTTDTTQTQSSKTTTAAS